MRTIIEQVKEQIKEQIKIKKQTKKKFRLSSNKSLKKFGLFILEKSESKKLLAILKKPEKSKKSRMKPLKTGYTDI